MKFLNLSNKVKVLALAIYAVVIIVITMLIINNKGTSEWFKDYSTNPYDENIFVVVRMSEVRNSELVNGTSYESSQYNAYVSVTKLDETAKISNIVYYVSTNSENNVRKSIDNSTGTKGSISESSTYTNKIYTKVAEKKVVVSDDKITYLDEEPKEVFVRVTYDVVKNNETTSHELKYRHTLTDVDDIKIKKLTKRSINENGSRVDYINNDKNKEYVDIKVVKEEGEKEDKAKYVENKITTNVVVNTTYLGNAAISYTSKNYKRTPEIHVEIFAIAENNPTDEKGFFSDYIRIVSFSGSFTTARSITNTFSYDSRYNIKQLIVLINYQIDGEQYTSNSIVDLI